MSFLDKPVSQLTLAELQRLVRREVAAQVPAIPKGVLALGDLDNPVVPPDGMTNNQVLVYHEPSSSFVAGGVSSTGDGYAPASPSPTPSIVGGIGTLVVSWSKVSLNSNGGTQADAVGYDVHISSVSSAFTPSAATLVGTTTATSYVIHTLADGLSPLVYNTPYYIKLVAFDVDGAASASSSGLDPNTAAAPKISADLGTIVAGLLIGTTVETAASGARVVLDTNGLKCYDGSSTDYGAGAGVVASIPTSGTPFLYGALYAAQGIRIDEAAAGTYTAAKAINWSTAADGTRHAWIQGAKLSSTTAQLKMQAEIGVRGNAGIVANVDSGASSINLLSATATDENTSVTFSPLVIGSDGSSSFVWGNWYQYQGAAFTKGTSTTSARTLMESANPALPSTKAAVHNRIGASYRVTVAGNYNHASAGGTLSLALKVGTTTIDSFTVAAPGVNASNQGFACEGVLIVKTAGAAGVVSSRTARYFNTSATPYVVRGSGDITVDLTSNAYIDVVATFASSSAANGITIDTVIVEKLS